MKLDRKQDLNVLYQVCFSGRSEKQDGCPGLWLAGTFLTSSLKPLNRIQRNLTGSKISMSSTKICVFQADRKNKMAALTSDSLRHFQLLLWNRWMKPTKRDRKQDLNIFFQVCVFRAGWKNKMATLASDWLRHFRLLLWNRWTEFNETWQEARSQRSLPSLCFSGRSEKQDGRPGLWLAETFDFSSETAERNSKKLDRKQDLNVLYQVCVFLGWSVNKNVRLGGFLKKVAHCTPVHDIWFFGPLVFAWISKYNSHVFFHFL